MKKLLKLKKIQYKIIIKLKQIKTNKDKLKQIKTNKNK
jgi:hypothetical protein